jgi:hypothetical protein
LAFGMTVALVRVSLGTEEKKNDNQDQPER